MIEVISDRSQFMALAPEWNRLAERFQSPMVRHEWFAASLDVFEADKELAVFIVRDGGRLRAAAPFVHGRTEDRVPRLYIVGHEVGEPNSFIYEDDDALAAIIDALLDERRPLVAPRLAVDGPALAGFRAGRFRGVRALRQSVENATASVPLGCDWPSFEARLSSHYHKVIRRLRRVAEREGAVQIDVAVPDESNLERHLDDMVRVESAGWKSRQGTSLTINTRGRRFASIYGAAAARLGMLRMFYLRIGETTAAVRMAIECGNRLWDLKIGYDERFARHSPGLLLTHETLRYACERGLAAQEFLGAAEAWQNRWPLEVRHYANVRLYPRTAAGALALAEDSGRFALRRVGPAVAAGLRRLRGINAGPKVVRSLAR